MLRTVVIILVLLFLVIGAGAAQTERPMAPPERPSGVQITNTPAEQEQRGLSREREGEEAQTQGREQNRARNEYVPLPPEPDTEFQQFVASSLGKRLPVFGQNLFRNVPSTFAPLDRVPVTPDYLIGPGTGPGACISPYRNTAQVGIKRAGVLSFAPGREEGQTLHLL